MNLAHWLHNISLVNGEKTATYFGKDADQSYAELAELISYIAAWLLENAFECGVMLQYL